MPNPALPYPILCWLQILHNRRVYFPTESLSLLDNQQLEFWYRVRQYALRFYASMYYRKYLMKSSAWLPDSLRYGFE